MEEGSGHSLGEDLSPIGSEEDFPAVLENLVNSVEADLDRVVNSLRQEAQGSEGGSVD